MVLGRKTRSNKRRQVSNEEFEAAIANSDNINVMAKLCSTFEGILPDDDIKSICYESVWITLGYHIPGMGNKFTTSLYFFLKKRLLRAVEKRDRLEYCDFDMSSVAKEERFDSEQLEHVKKKILCLNDEEREIVNLYYFDNLNFTQISKRTGISKTKVVGYFKRSIRKLKLWC